MTATSTTLASTTVAAEATLLALFFASRSEWWASTTYSSVPATIRNLFIEERTSTIYTNGIARALVFTSALLALGTAGYHARVLTVAVAVILAIVAVLRLLVIGTATFSYFDPASLTEVLPGRFQHALMRAATGSTAADKANQLRTQGCRNSS